MERLTCAWMAAVWLMACGQASATVFEVAAGPDVTSSGRITTAIFASAFGESLAGNRIQFEPIGTIGWLDSRDTRKSNLNHQVWLAAGGVRVASPKRRWFVSEQIAATSARTDALSSPFEFMTSIGWQGGHFIVQLRHISNAHLLGGGKNVGETMILAGVRW